MLNGSRRQVSGQHADMLRSDAAAAADDCRPGVGPSPRPDAVSFFTDIRAQFVEIGVGSGIFALRGEGVGIDAERYGAAMGAYGGARHREGWCHDLWLAAIKENSLGSEPQGCRRRISDAFARAQAGHGLHIVGVIFSA